MACRGRADHLLVWSLRTFGSGTLRMGRDDELLGFFVEIYSYAIAARARKKT